jgi:DNA-binding Lrp family transcriptional regulator
MALLQQLTGATKCVYRVSKMDSQMRSRGLDRIDLNILAHLQKNGRMSNVELAGCINLSASPCLLRVKRLQKLGYVTGYHASLDIAKLGNFITIFVQITLSTHKYSDFYKFERVIAGVSEIMECHLVSGGFDYLLKFVGRDIAHYQETIEGLLEREIGIHQYFTHVVIKSPVARQDYPIEKLIST